MSSEGDLSVILQKMQKSTEELSRLEEELAYEDRLLKELAILLRDKNLRNLFQINISVQGVVGSAVNHLLCITVANNSYQEFTPPFWMLCMSFRGESKTISKTIKLLIPFTQSSPLFCAFPVEIRQLTFPMEVECYLATVMTRSDSNGEIEATENGSTLLQVLLGKVELDMSYFIELQPSSKLPLRHITEDDNINNMLDKVATLYGRYHRKDITRNPFHVGSFSYKFCLPENASLASIYKHFSRNVPENCGELGKSVVTVGMKNKSATLEFDTCNKALILRSQDREFLNHLKNYFVGSSCFRSPEDGHLVLVQRSHLAKAKVLRLSLNLCDLNQFKDIRHLENLRHELRNSLTQLLPL